MGTTWKCRCGKPLKIDGYKRPGRWVVFASCDCGRKVTITKRGMKERRTDAATIRLGK